jgi:outer membrane protein assembly factor BamD
MPRKVLYATLALAMLLSLSACTLLKWGGPAKAPAPEPQADDVFRQGEDLLAKGKYEEARKKYSSVKERDLEKSYDALVQVRLGDSYYEEGRYAEAEVEYRRFIETRPQNKAAAYVLYQIGMCNFKQMDKPDRDPSFSVNAMTSFESLLKNYPNSPYEEEAREKLKITKWNVAEHELVVGKYYYKRGSFSAAAKRFKGILESYPGAKDEPETLYCLADSYIKTGEFDSAKNTLSVLYQQYPNNRFAERAKDKLAGHIPVK